MTGVTFERLEAVIKEAYALDGAVCDQRLGSQGFRERVLALSRSEAKTMVRDTFAWRRELKDAGARRWATRAWTGRTTTARSAR
eukprot:9017302-Alexandrium_andersonii.AAC.1